MRRQADECVNCRHKILMAAYVLAVFRLVLYTLLPFSFAADVLLNKPLAVAPFWKYSFPNIAPSAHPALDILNPEAFQYQAICASLCKLLTLPIDVT